MGTLVFWVGWYICIVGWVGAGLSDCLCLSEMVGEPAPTEFWGNLPDTIEPITNVNYQLSTNYLPVNVSA
jgi:hypothetical protein